MLFFFSFYYYLDGRLFRLNSLDKVWCFRNLQYKSLLSSQVKIIANGGPSLDKIEAIINLKYHCHSLTNNCFSRHNHYTCFSILSTWWNFLMITDGSLHEILGLNYGPYKLFSSLLFLSPKWSISLYLVLWEHTLNTELGYVWIDFKKKKLNLKLFWNLF